MAKAFRCDECGEFFDGVSSAERKDKFGKWEVTHSIREAPQPLAETAAASDDDEEDKQVHSSGSWFISYSSFLYGDQRRVPDFCGRCTDAIIDSSRVLAVPA